MLIYKITNNINGKIYIGQTTRTLSKRIIGYKHEARYKPDSRPITRAMNKYGFENFTFEVLEDNIESITTLNKRERYYIETLQSMVGKNGYNVELGGNGVGKHSEETKRKISEAQRGELNHMWGAFGAASPSSKRVIDLTTGTTYGAAMEAARVLGLNFSHICAVCRGTRGSTGNRVFRYLDEKGEIILPKERAYIKAHKTKNAVLPQYKKYI